MRIARQTKKRLFYALLLLILIVCGLLLLNIHNNSNASERFYDSIPETPAINTGDKGAFEIWGKNEDGYHLIDTLYFGKTVSSKIIHINESFSTITLVKKYGYEINIDELTLNGVAPVGYERKLKYADNDLIEITDTTEFNLNGSGKLVVAARAPVAIAGTEYAFHFPHKHNEYYQYTIGQNIGNFTIEVPESKYLFHEETIQPGSGHPKAPISWYVANDNNYLYVYTEVFGDNTLDHGKDYAKAKIKTANGIKEYAVHTTKDNQYGEWEFTYTDTKPKYNYQHMLYLIKIPRQDISESTINISFEYYGTLSAMALDYLTFRKLDDEGNPMASVKFKVFDELENRYLYSSCEVVDRANGGNYCTNSQQTSDMELNSVDLSDNGESDFDPNDESNYISESDENGIVKFYLTSSYYQAYVDQVMNNLYDSRGGQWADIAATDGNLLTPEQIEERQNCSPTGRCWESFSITDEQPDGRTYTYHYSYYRSDTMMYSYVDYTLEATSLPDAVHRSYVWGQEGQKYYYDADSTVLQYFGYNNKYDAALRGGKLKLTEVSTPKGYKPIAAQYLAPLNVKTEDYSDYEYSFKDIINEIETFDINGTIRWIDDKDSSGIRPAKSTIKLYRDGELIDETEVVKDNDEDLWHFSFPKLPKYDRSGKEYKYTITQDDIPQYASDITNFDIVNEYSTNTPKPINPSNPANPKTGDNSPLVYAVIIMLLSISIAVLANKILSFHNDNQ